MNSVQLKISSVNKLCLTLYLQFMLNLLKHHKVCYKTNFLPTKKKRVTFLKSSHVNKRAQEHFLIKHFGASIVLNNVKFNLTFLSQVILAKPSSLQIKVKILRG